MSIALWFIVGISFLLLLIIFMLFYIAKLLSISLNTFRNYFRYYVDIQETQLTKDEKKE